MTEAFCTKCGRCRTVRTDNRAACAAMRVTCPAVDAGGECDVQIRTPAPARVDHAQAA